MVELIFWIVIGIGVAGLAASIYIDEHGGTAEPPVTQDDQEPTHAV